MNTSTIGFERPRFSPSVAISVMAVLTLGALALGACDDEAVEGDGDYPAEPGAEPGEADLECLGLDKEACAARSSCHAVFGRTSRDVPGPQSSEELGVETDGYKYMFCWPGNCHWDDALSCMRSSDASLCLLVSSQFSASGCSDGEIDYTPGWKLATCGEGNCPEW